MAISFLDILKKKNPDLWNVIVQNAGGNKAKLEEALRNGNVESLSPNLKGIQSQINQALGTSKDIYNQTLESTKDEANLTQDELQNRLEAFQGLSNSPQEYERVLNLSPIKESIKQRIANEPALTPYAANTLGTPSLDKGLDYALSAFSQGQPFSEQTFAEIIANENTKVDSDQFELLKKLGIRLHDLVRPTIDWNSYYENKPIAKKDTSEDISRIEDALTTRRSAAEKESAIEGYIAGIPAELQANREEFMKGEEDRAYGELERQVPLVLQNLNVRGMLASGEREDELTSRALNLGSSLEQIQSDLEAEDNQFYYDAAYRNALRKELASVEDYRSTIETKRGDVIKERERSYQSKQSELNRSLEEDLTKSNYARDLALRRKEAEKAKQEKEDDRTAQLIATGAGAATSIAGNAAIAAIG